MPLTPLVFFLSYCAAMIGTFRRPALGAFTYVLLVFIHPPTTWWGSYFGDVRWSLLTATTTLLASLLYSSDTHDSISDGLTKIAYLGIFFFLCFLCVSLTWAIVESAQIELIILYSKYFLLTILFVKLLKDGSIIKGFVFIYVSGAFILGSRAYGSHVGGRFEKFGSEGFNEANTAALALAIALFFAGTLFLTVKPLKRVAMLFPIAIIANGFVSAGSRSGLLALVAGGVAYLWYCPRQFKRLVFPFALLASLMVVILANNFFLSRMKSIAFLGADNVVVESDFGSRKVDTGSSRVAIMKLQWKLFLNDPLGSGSRTLAAVAPFYLPENLLTKTATGRATRSSHNTMLSFLVDHGIVGGAFYFGYLVWCWRSLVSLRQWGQKVDNKFLQTLVPALAASMVALEVSGIFINYVKLELRFWLIALTIATLHVMRKESEAGAQLKS